MMETVRRVLVVDNDPIVRSSIQRLLETRDFEVLSASSAQQARAILRTEPIHLALLDIRLEDDTDPNDTSGLDLAEEMDPIVARIILTGYASYEHTRRALGHRIDTVPALDVISKKDPPATWLGAVERAFRERLGINFGLQDDLIEGLSYASMAAELKLDVEEAEAETVPRQLRELLRKLFAEAETVLVSPLGREGRTEGCSHSGATLVKVIPRYRGRGWGAAVVAKLGPRSQIEKESLNYEQHVHGFIGGHRHTSKEKAAYTLHLGGVVYSLIGTSLDDVWDLSAFYRHHPSEVIVQALENLFARTCQHWYDNKQEKKNHSITTLYSSQLNLTPEKLEAAMTKMFSEYAGCFALEFPKIDRSFPNPIRWIRERDLHALTRLCTTHGDLHGGNVFVDANRQCWLIDFARTGEGHILRDFIELETDIKFSLLPETSWYTLYEFELALAFPRRFGEVPELPHPFAQEELNKAFEAIKTLRRLAHDAVKPSDDMYEYYCGLLYQTLNIVRLHKISPFHKRHALLSAALICERLDNWREPWPPPPPPPEDTDRIQLSRQQRRTHQNNLNKLEEKSVISPSGGTRDRESPQSGPRSDVFLSYQRADQEAVEYLARRLREAGLQVWLDRWNLIPGEPWQEALEEALDQSRTCAVFWGPRGLGPWQNEEMRAALERRVRKQSCRVIPVLLPGCPEPKEAKMPSFLKRVTWVDFREGLDGSEALKSLVAGIRGVMPGPDGDNI